jgi:hypothetical protein
MFWLITLVFMTIALWLLHNEFISDESIGLWSRLIGVFDSENLKLESLGLVYPHASYYTLTLFHYLGPLDSPMSTFLVTALFASGLIVLWNRHLQSAGHDTFFRISIIALIALHPAMLWTATAGTLGSISLICFYLLYIATIRMIYEQDIHAFMMIGFVLALFYFVDEVTLYLFIALVPLLVMIVPRIILLEAPVSAYVILATPLLIVALGWMYFNWIFYGSALAFVNDPDSGFLGSRHYVLDSDWLKNMGGQWAAPAFYALVMILLCYPVILLLLARIKSNRLHFNAALVLLLHPVIAVGFATYDYYLRHPMEITSLVLAGIMAELTIVDSRRKKTRWMIFLMLIAGTGGGWYLFFWQPTPTMQQWAMALTGVTQPDTHRGDRALGEWLKNQRQQTLIDDRSAFRAIVVRGDAKKLVLPFNDQFKIELSRNEPTVRQIAVPDPKTSTGRIDRINSRWPELFSFGSEHYHLAYDHQGWRVWRRYDK